MIPQDSSRSALEFAALIQGVDLEEYCDKSEHYVFDDKELIGYRYVEKK